MSKDGRKTALPDLHELKLGKAKVFLLGTIKGLKSEETNVKAAFEKAEPLVIGLHIHRGEIKGLGAAAEGKIKEMGLSHSEEIYASNLSKYGEVQVPPPSLVAAYRIAKKHDIPLRPLDMSDDDFADAYTKNISTFQLIRHSLNIKKLKKRKFYCADARAFIMEWDRAINKYKGYRVLEIIRERKMAENIKRLAKRYDRVFAVLEIERLDGVMASLLGSDVFEGGKG